MKAEPEEKDYIVVPVLFWASIGDKRIEEKYSIKIPLPQGHCPECAKQYGLRASAEILASQVIKTGITYL